MLLDAFRGLGAGLSRLTERWVPDAWVICLILTCIALFLAVVGAGAGVEEAVLAWGDGVWVLLTLAMQFTIAMVAAHACVSSRPVFRLLDALAAVPNPAKPVQAVALAAGFSLITAYLNWALCLVACALFVPFLCRRNPQTDVRVLIAASYIGLGTVWHCGLSGSAPLILATPDNPLLAPGAGAAVVDRLYPVTETLFHPFNLLYMFAIGAAGLGAAVALHPRRDAVTFSPAQIEAMLPKPPEVEPPARTPAARVDAFRGWVWLAAGLLAYPLGHSIVTRGFGTSWTINAYNATFLAAALLLHGRPLSFLRACRQGVDAAWGIILQFPFYAGIFGLMQNTNLGAWIGEFFAEFSTQRTYPFVIYLYSGVMNLFVPSAGSKWLIEAPYLIPAGEQLDVSVVTVLLAYAYGDSTSNLIQPFFAIPILAVTRVRFGDVVGYTFLIACACFLVSTLAMALIPTNL
ncbi:MAG: short-chain fatty acid transporter [Deltaproteobacteria bacterium]|nr:short-chain fatty acid transporter [Deltaproteobacteria bacterium]MBW2362557.1 short-chain fatty acid transporter [Deltaproteobacteria bacterium]